MKTMWELAGLKRQGKKKWRHQVNKVVQQLKSAVQADYVVLGGGNARLLKRSRPARAWETMHTHSKADTAFGQRGTADQLMSDSSMKRRQHDANLYVLLN